MHDAVQLRRWFVTEERNKSPGTLPVLFWNLFYLLICSCSTCLSSHTRSQCSCSVLEPPLLFFCVLGLCWTFLGFCLPWLPMDDSCLLDFPLLPSPDSDPSPWPLLTLNDLLLEKLPDDWFSNLWNVCWILNSTEREPQSVHEAARRQILS